MDSNIITSIITSIFTLVGVLITVAVGNTKTKYRIEQLEKKFDLLDSVSKDIVRLDEKVTALQERVDRIDD